jgi:hypothetical protein
LATAATATGDVQLGPKFDALSLASSDAIGADTSSSATYRAFDSALRSVVVFYSELELLQSNPSASLALVPPTAGQLGVVNAMCGSSVSRIAAEVQSAYLVGLTARAAAGGVPSNLQNRPSCRAAEQASPTNPSAWLPSCAP